MLLPPCRGQGRALSDFPKPALRRGAGEKRVSMAGCNGIWPGWLIVYGREVGAEAGANSSQKAD